MLHEEELKESLPHVTRNQDERTTEALGHRRQEGSADGDAGKDRDNAKVSLCVCSLLHFQLSEHLPTGYIISATGARAPSDAPARRFLSIQLCMSRASTQRYNVHRQPPARGTRYVRFSHG